MKTPTFQLQIINVYNQEYESGAAFWPDVHFRVIIALIVSQIVLMGLLTTKKAASSTPFLIVLPVLTIWFHIYCKGRFEPAFVRYPLQVCQLIILMANNPTSHVCDLDFPSCIYASTTFILPNL